MLLLDLYCFKKRRFNFGGKLNTVVCYLVEFDNSFVMVDPLAIKILREVTIIKLMLLKIFNQRSRYLGDVLTIDDPSFEQIERQTYPAKLQ